MKLVSKINGEGVHHRRLTELRRGVRGGFELYVTVGQTPALTLLFKHFFLTFNRNKKGKSKFVVVISYLYT